MLGPVKRFRSTVVLPAFRRQRTEQGGPIPSHQAQYGTCESDDQCCAGASMRAKASVARRPTRPGKAKGWQRWVLAALPLFLACSRQATVVLHDGRTVHGRIIENNDGVIALESNTSGTIKIAEQQVNDIEHPGKAAMYSGAALLAAGAVVFTLLALQDCTVEPDGPTESDHESAANRASRCRGLRTYGMVVGGATGATGIGVGYYGFDVQEDSRTRAAKRLPRIPTDQSIRLVPRLTFSTRF